MLRPAIALAACLLLLPAQRAQAETSNCTAINSLPTTITSQGVYCLKKDLSTSISSGAAITIASNNVTIDCNDWKIGGLAGGPGTQAVGIESDGRKNITIRNCGIRGFKHGIWADGPATAAYHLIENNRIDLSTMIGIFVWVDSFTIRGNRILDTAGDDLWAVGIYATGEGEVLDNTVAGVSAGSNSGLAYGIYAENPGTGAIISRNRVSGLSSVQGAQHGIATMGRQVISDNVILRANTPAAANHYGISCQAGMGSVARDNILVGFANPATTVSAGCTSSNNTAP
jgi:hypothetical protein